jgi:hypothetical protein
MIITAGCVAVVAAVLALIWTMQRRLMYFPSGGMPEPGEIGLTDVEPVTFEIVPIENSRRLYDAAVAPKTLLVLPDADHNDYELLAGDEMVLAIVRVLQPLR